MFPYTHICFAKDILGDLNNEIILGAIFPDTVIAGFLEHAQTHQRCTDVYNYLTGVGVFRDFSTALITHGTCPKGLDFYCDEKYLDFERGYAFEMARPLISKVVKCCKLPERMGWWKAHNFIEMAAELWVYNNHSDSYKKLAQALDDHNLILALSQQLALFYGISVTKIALSFPIYGEFVVMDEVTPVALARKYGKQTAKKHGINIDVPGAASVIEEALEIVNQTFLDFLQTCQNKVGHLIKNLKAGESEI